MTQLDRLEALAEKGAEIRKTIEGFAVDDQSTTLQRLVSRRIEIEQDLCGRVTEALPDLIRVARAAKKQRQAEDEMLSVVSISGHGRVESRTVTEWIDAGAETDVALAPLFVEAES